MCVSDCATNADVRAAQNLSNTYPLYVTEPSYPLPLHPAGQRFQEGGLAAGRRPEQQRQAALQPCKLVAGQLLVAEQGGVWPSIVTRAVRKVLCV